MATQGNTLSYRSMDWGKCIFCQITSRSCPTTCPADSKRADVGCGYKSLAVAVDGFIKCGQLPADINASLWDDGDGIEQTLTNNKGV